METKTNELKIESLEEARRIYLEVFNKRKSGEITAQEAKRMEKEGDALMKKFKKEFKKLTNR